MRPISLILGLLLISPVALAAKAESTTEALKNFGLLGTWSSDCAKDLSKEEGARDTYAAGIFTEPTLVMISRGPSGLDTVQQKIVSAVRITEDKIKIVVKFTSVTNSNAPNLDRSDGTTWHSVIQKIGTKIKTIEDQRDDGKLFGIRNGMQVNGLPAPLGEKCFN